MNKFRPNQAVRQIWLDRGAGKALAIHLLETLQRRSKRSTLELIQVLSDIATPDMFRPGQDFISREQFNAITSMARKFTQRHEQADIRAVRDEVDGRLYHYFLIFDPDNMLRRGLDVALKMASYSKAGLKVLDAMSAYTMDGQQGEAHEMLVELLSTVVKATEITASYVNDRVPGALKESRNNAKPPTLEERGIPNEKVLPPVTPRSLWEIAKAKTPHPPSLEEVQHAANVASKRAQKDITIPEGMFESDFCE